MKSQESHSCSVPSVFSPLMLLGKGTNISCEKLHSPGRGGMLFSKESKEPQGRPEVPAEPASQTSAPWGLPPTARPPPPAQPSSISVSFYRQHSPVLLRGCFQCIASLTVTKIQLYFYPQGWKGRGKLFCCSFGH